MLVRGTRFAAHAHVSLSLEGGAPFAVFDADGRGRFAITVPVPAAPAGMRVLDALAVDPVSGTSTLSTSAITIIAEAAAPTVIATSTLAPSSILFGPATIANIKASASSGAAATGPSATPMKPATSTSVGAATTASSGVFTPEADARVEQAHPSTNYGSATTLRVDGDPGAQIQSYIRFTASGISGPVRSAILRLHVTSNGGSDGPWVLPANNNWKEASITWASSPPTWGHPTSDLGDVPANSWVSFDVTPLVTKTGQYTFKLVSSSVDRIEFSSRESSQPPQLLINQSLPISPTPSPAASPMGATRAASAIAATGSVVSPTPGQGDASTNPFAGETFFIDPSSAAKAQATAWRSSRPDDASEMDKIANEPQADWFDNGSGDISTAVDRRVSTIAAAGALPVLVAYNIPKRDCVGTGASSAIAYQNWIRSFAKAIGTRKAVVILEPDALANIGCLSDSEQSARISLIKDAVTVLEAQPGVAVYIDAGHSNWISASAMAGLLIEAGIDQAQGFSLNVASFGLTADNVAYGRDLSARVGGKHFIIDTSRNGLGPAPDYGWCNPPGRALGPKPTTSTGDPLVDAYFWVKRPGESDGTCNGGPVAGIWWADYALGLAQRAP